LFILAIKTLKSKIYFIYLTTTSDLHYLFNLSNSSAAIIYSLKFYDGIRKSKVN